MLVEAELIAEVHVEPAQVSAQPVRAQQGPAPRRIAKSQRVFESGSEAERQRQVERHIGVVRDIFAFDDVGESDAAGGVAELEKSLPLHEHEAQAMPEERELLAN